MTKAAFICSPDLWQRGHGAAHPLKPERLQRTYELLAAYGAFDGPESMLVQPRQATPEELSLVHTEEYVERPALDQQEDRARTRVSGVEVPCPETPKETKETGR